MKIQKGDQFRAGNLDPSLYHVRGKVDGQVVLRRWSPSKQRWIYVIEDPSALGTVYRKVGACRSGRPKRRT